MIPPNSTRYLVYVDKVDLDRLQSQLKQREAELARQREHIRKQEHIIDGLLLRCEALAEERDEMTTAFNASQDARADEFEEAERLRTQAQEMLDEAQRAALEWDRYRAAIDTIRERVADPRLGAPQWLHELLAALSGEEAR